MIAYFGRYDQAKRWAKENNRPLRDLVIMPMGIEKLQGVRSEIEVQVAGDFVTDQESQKAAEIIQMYNYQFALLNAPQEAPDA